jgi:hypothetical protein
MFQFHRRYSQETVEKMIDKTFESLEEHLEGED